MSGKWRVREVVRHDGDTLPTFRDVETGLSKRRAMKSAAEWQAASNANKVMVARVAPTAKLPHVLYTAVQS